MVPSHLPYPWKIVVAAAVIAVLIVAVMEIRKRRSKSEKARPPLVEMDDSGNSAIYDDTLSHVQDIIGIHLGMQAEVIMRDMRFADLGVDPLTRVEIAEALESAYRIELPTDPLNAAETVDDLVRLVIKQQQGGSPRIP